MLLRDLLVIVMEDKSYVTYLNIFMAVVVIQNLLHYYEILLYIIMFGILLYCYPGDILGQRYINDFCCCCLNY